MNARACSSVGCPSARLIVPVLLLADASPAVAGKDAEQAIDPRNAFIMTTMMRDVVRFGTAVIAGAGDREMLARGTHDPLCPTGFVARQRLAKDQAASYPGFAATTFIDTDTPLGPIAGLDGRVAPLPGHTPGSLVVIVPGAVFTGDLLRGAIVGGGAELHFYMCDVEKNRRDVRGLVEGLPPGPAAFFVGHFGPLSREQVASRFR